MTVHFHFALFADQGSFSYANETDSTSVIALHTLFSSGMDALVVDSFLVEK